MVLLKCCIIKCCYSFTFIISELIHLIIRLQLFHKHLLAVSSLIIGEHSRVCNLFNLFTKWFWIYTFLVIILNFFTGRGFCVWLVRMLTKKRFWIYTSQLLSFLSLTPLNFTLLAVLKIGMLQIFPTSNQPFPYMPVRQNLANEKSV
jgi:hypothetical protein